MSAVEPYTYIDRYEGEYLPTHPLASKSGFVFTHRKVLYEKLGPGSHPCHWCGRMLTWGIDLHVDHLNDDRLDNRPDNLVPSCRHDNIGRTHGTLYRRLHRRADWRSNKARLEALGHLPYLLAHVKSPRTSQPLRPGLSDTAVYDMRRRYAAGVITIEELASEHSCSLAIIRNAIDGTTWRHLSGAVPIRNERRWMTLRRFTDAEEQRIGEEYRRGGTFSSLAARHGCAPATIRDILKRVGVSGRSLRRGPTRKRAIIDGYRAGHAVNDLAEQFGASGEEIRRVLRVAGGIELD